MTILEIWHPASDLLISGVVLIHDVSKFFFETGIFSCTLTDSNTS